MTLTLAQAPCSCSSSRYKTLGDGKIDFGETLMVEPEYFDPFDMTYQDEEERIHPELEIILEELPSSQRVPSPSRRKSPKKNQPTTPQPNNAEPEPNLKNNSINSASVGNANNEINNSSSKHDKSNKENNTGQKILPLVALPHDVKISALDISGIAVHKDLMCGIRAVLFVDGNINLVSEPIIRSQGEDIYRANWKNESTNDSVVFVANLTQSASRSESNNIAVQIGLISCFDFHSDQTLLPSSESVVMIGKTNLYLSEPEKSTIHTIYLESITTDGRDAESRDPCETMSTLSTTSGSRMRRGGRRVKKLARKMKRKSSKPQNDQKSPFGLHHTGCMLNIMVSVKLSGNKTPSGRFKPSKETNVVVRKKEEGDFKENKSNPLHRKLIPLKKILKSSTAPIESKRPTSSITFRKALFTIGEDNTEFNDDISDIDGGRYYPHGMGGFLSLSRSSSISESYLARTFETDTEDGRESFFTYNQERSVNPQQAGCGLVCAAVRETGCLHQLCRSPGRALMEDINNDDFSTDTMLTASTSDSLWEDARYVAKEFQSEVLDMVEIFRCNQVKIVQN